MKTPFFATLILIAGCSSPRQPAANVHAVHAQDVTHPGEVQAKDNDESTILGKMWDIPDDTAQKIGGLSVRAQAPYRSASGRTCRSVELTEQGGTHKQLLACTQSRSSVKPSDERVPDSQLSWVFVPTVFIQETRQNEASQQAPSAEAVHPSRPDKTELASESSPSARANHQ